jgi:hypothetical protein
MVQPLMIKLCMSSRLQVDQWGILHAPFAPARAYLVEYGHQDADIIIHCVRWDAVCIS